MFSSAYVFLQQLVKFFKFLVFLKINSRSTVISVAYLQYNARFWSRLHATIIHQTLFAGCLEYLGSAVVLMCYLRNSVIKFLIPFY